MPQLDGSLLVLVEGVIAQLQSMHIVGCASIDGMSTCKQRKVEHGDSSCQPVAQSIPM